MKTQYIYWEVGIFKILAEREKKVPAMLYTCRFLPASLAITGIAGEAVCTRKTAAVLKERRNCMCQKKSYHYIIKNNRKVTSSSRRKPE